MQGGQELPGEGRITPGTPNFFLFSIHFSTLSLNLGLCTSDRATSNCCRTLQAGTVFSKIKLSINYQMPVMLLVKPHQYLLPEKSNRISNMQCIFPYKKIVILLFLKKTPPKTENKQKKQPKPQTNSNKTPKISG